MFLLQRTSWIMANVLCFLSWWSHKARTQYSQVTASRCSFRQAASTFPIVTCVYLPCPNHPCRYITVDRMRCVRLSPGNVKNYMLQSRRAWTESFAYCARSTCCVVRDAEKVRYVHTCILETAYKLCRWSNYEIYNNIMLHYNKRSNLVHYRICMKHRRFFIPPWQSGHSPPSKVRITSDWSIIDSGTTHVKYTIAFG